MRHLPPLTLGCTVALRPADRTGDGTTGPAVWLGACFPEGLRLRQEFSGSLVTASGAEYPAIRPIPLRHEIELADQCAIETGQKVCFALAEHSTRIRSAIERFVEPQIQQLLDELSQALEPPG